MERHHSHGLWSFQRNDTIHMVYGTTDKTTFFKQSKDDGMSWSTAIKLNEGPGPTAGMVTTTMGERGPKISVSPDGSIHVIWMDLWAAGVHTYARGTLP